MCGRLLKIPSDGRRLSTWDREDKLSRFMIPLKLFLDHGEMMRAGLMSGVGTMGQNAYPWSTLIFSFHVEELSYTVSFQGLCPIS